MSQLVAEQRGNVDNLANLQTPKERVYNILNPELRKHLELDDWLEEN